VVSLVPVLAGVVIVTIPSDVSQLVVRKSITVAREEKASILGLIENMAGLFPGPDTATLAAEAGIPFLGAVPFDRGLSLAGDRGVATEAGVAPVPIVVMQPFGELEPPLARVTKPAGIGPLVECGLDEALGLAVRARSVRPREEVANPEPLTGLTKAPRSIA